MSVRARNSRRRGPAGLRRGAGYKVGLSGSVAKRGGGRRFPVGKGRSPTVRGPNVLRTAASRRQVLSVAGAYGADENNTMLTITERLSVQKDRSDISMLEQARARTTVAWSVHRLLYCARRRPACRSTTERDELVNESNGVCESNRRGGYARSATPRPRVECGSDTAFDNYRENMFFKRSGDEDGVSSRDADEGPGLPGVSTERIRTARAARLAEFGLARATSGEGCCTGCCVCARSRRTTEVSAGGGSFPRRARSRR